MQISAHHSVSPVSTATPSWFPPKNPDVYEAYRTVVLQTRDAVQHAAVALTSTRRMDPANPFWAYRAVQHLGIATGLLQAAEALKAAGGFKFGSASMIEALEGARSAVVSDQLSVARGLAPDRTVYEQARATALGAVKSLGFWLDQLPVYVPPAPPVPPA